MADHHVSDHLPGYALGILDAQTEHEVSLHLTLCAQCRNELAEYQNATELLLNEVPLKEPPRRLKAFVVERVRSQINRTSEQAARNPILHFVDELKVMFLRPAGMVVAGVVLLIILIFAANSMVLSSQIAELKAALPDKDIRIVLVSGTEHAPTTTGYLLMIKNETAGTITVHHAPVLDAKYQYQIWMLKDGKRTSGGLFTVNSAGYGSTTIQIGQPLDSFQSIGITIEPVGGSPEPTGKKILGGKL